MVASINIFVIVISLRNGRINFQACALREFTVFAFTRKNDSNKFKLFSSSLTLLDVCYCHVNLSFHVVQLKGYSCRMQKVCKTREEKP